MLAIAAAKLIRAILDEERMETLKRQFASNPELSAYEVIDAVYPEIDEFCKHNNELEEIAMILEEVRNGR